MSSAAELVKSYAENLRAGLERADKLMREEQARLAEQKVAERLPEIPGEETWDEFGLD